MAPGQPPTARPQTLAPALPYRPEIDGLRALAVTAVIINHFNGKILPSGYLGVDIFFVISGYVITASLLSNHGHNLGDHLAGFYLRRIKRLVPALVLFVLPMAVLICLVNPTPGDSLQTGFMALFGLSNLVLNEQATNYFAASTQLNAFTHTWSLGVEEQFYAIFPPILWYCLSEKPSRKPLLLTLALALALALLLGVAKISTGHLFGLIPGQMQGLATAIRYGWPLLLIPLCAAVRLGRSGLGNALVMVSLLSLLSLVGFLALYQGHQATAYFLMPWRFWELGAGCLVLLVGQARPGWRQWHGRGLVLASGLALVLALFLPQELGAIATVGVVGLTVILIDQLRPTDSAYKLLSRKTIVKLGKISYSLYLWHWGILALSRWTIGVHAWSIPFQVLTMLTAAWLSYRWVETPLRRANWSRRRARTIGLGLAVLVLSASFVLALERWGGELALDRRFPTPWSTSLLKGADAFNAQIQVGNQVDERGLAAVLERDQRGLPLARPRLYIFGDSHANHYVSALKEALPSMGVGSAVVGWQCGYIDPADINSQTQKWLPDCQKYSRFVDAFLAANLRSDDVVLVAHRWKEKKANAHTESTLNHLAEIIQAKQARLLLIDDVPEIGAITPLLCSKRPWRPFPATSCFRSQEDVNSDQRRYDAIAERIIKSYPRVQYAQLRTLYCENNSCGPYKGELMLYQDSDHLTVAASRLGAERLAAMIRNQPQASDPTASTPPTPSRINVHATRRSG
jgi:peptidoglycan/LPS O-acetylase OafA/YrhL